MRHWLDSACDVPHEEEAVSHREKIDRKSASEKEAHGEKTYKRTAKCTDQDDKHRYREDHEYQNERRKGQEECQDDWVILGRLFPRFAGIYGRLNPSFVLWYSLLWTSKSHLS